VLVDINLGKASVRCDATTLLGANPAPTICSTHRHHPDLSVPPLRSCDSQFTPVPLSQQAVSCRPVPCCTNGQASSSFKQRLRRAARRSLVPSKQAIEVPVRGRSPPLRPNTFLYASCRSPGAQRGAPDDSRANLPARAARQDAKTRACCALRWARPGRRESQGSGIGWCPLPRPTRRQRRATSLQSFPSFSSSSSPDHPSQRVPLMPVAGPPPSSAPRRLAAPPRTRLLVPSVSLPRSPSEAKTPLLFPRRD
jgi:hypothetical protein